MARIRAVDATAIFDRIKVVYEFHSINYRGNWHFGYRSRPKKNKKKRDVMSVGCSDKSLMKNNRSQHNNV